MSEAWASAIRVLLLVIATAPLFYYVISLYCIVDFFRGLRRVPPRDDHFAPPVSILKPVRGLDHDAYSNFASYCGLNYPQYELVFAIADPNDPVIPVIHKLQADFPGTRIRYVTDVPRVGENNKVNSLCSLVNAAQYDFLVMSDSDVRVMPGYLREVLAPFFDPRVGAVTSFYRCSGGGSLPADLDMLGMCTDSVPAALVARQLEGKVQFAFGWTMATTRQILTEIGGWEAMANHHSDDFELGNRIAAKNYRVEFMREPVAMVFSKETWREFLRHELRWAIGLRNVRPAGYVGLIFTHGLPWAILGAAVAMASAWPQLALAYLVVYLTLRIGAARAAGVWGLRDANIGRKLWLVPLRDAVTFIVWFAAFFTSKIHWRGLEYRVKNRLLLPLRVRPRTLKAKEPAVPGLK